MSDSNGLPLGWAKAKLADVIQPRRERVSPKDHPKARFIGMDNVEAHSMKILGTVPASTMKSSSASFEINDVLYGRLRPYLNKVVRPDFQGLASAEFIVFPDTNYLRSSFLQYRLNAIDFVSYASHLDEGDRPRVDFDQIGNFDLLLPPEAEQLRIVAKIEELFSDLDAGIKALKRAKANLKRYRAAVLKAAVEGKLTEEWRAENPDTEPASELLERILIERRQRWEEEQLAKYEAKGTKPPKGWNERYKEPAVPDVNGQPKLPKSWCWTSIGQCFKVAVGATPSRKVSDYWNGSIPWVSSGEVQFCRIAKTKESITGVGLANSSTQINPVGSVMLGMIGEGKTRGQTAILEIDAANNQNCAAIWVPSTPVVPEFVYYYLYSQYEVTRQRGSGNNQPALNKTRVENILFPLPPVDEQRAITDQLELSLSVVDQLESGSTVSLRRASRLRQSILKRAFEGKLVPQDPNDEPAGKLLARIAAERKMAQEVNGSVKKNRPKRKKAATKK